MYWDNFDWSTAKQYAKNYPAPLKKGGLKKTTTADIVTNGGFEYYPRFAGWATWFQGPGVVVPFPRGVANPDSAWIVGAYDPYGSDPSVYPTTIFPPHTQELWHSRNSGASAIQNYPTLHRLYQNIMLPAGKLTLKFWIRWKNQGPPVTSQPNWIDIIQDIRVTFRNSNEVPPNDAILATWFKASSLNLPLYSGGGDRNTANYEERTADISSFAGQTVRLDFEVNGMAYPLFVDFDDIAIVQANQPPVAYAGDNQTVEGTSPSGAPVVLDGSGSSDPDNDPLTYNWTWTDGSATGVNPTVTLPLGSREITLTVDDGKGGIATAKVVVTVVDTTPPTITVPLVVTASTGSGATTCSAFVGEQMLGPASAQDNCDGTVPVTRSGVPGGNLFPVGTTEVTYTATDAHGNTAKATQKVTVKDNTPPTITAPPAVTAYTGPGAITCGAVVNDLGQATASDNCLVASVTPSGVPAGNFFPVGTTVVKYTATDAAGNTATATQDVTVIDNTPPTILSCSVSTPLLWPPNHKFVNVGLRVNVTDACDPNPKVSIKVYSDEDNDKEKGDDNGKDDDNEKGKDKDKDKGKGDDKDSPDAKDIGASTLQLRAERSGKGDGRVYLIVVTATDKSGNTAFSSCTVVVPHSESKKAIADVNAQAAAAKASCGPNGSPLTPFLIGLNQ